MKLQNAPILFFKDLMNGPLWVNIWVQILMLANLAGVFFWSYAIAQVIFYTFIVTAMLMMLLYYKFGMTRILGLGHILWLILVPYLIVTWPSLSGDIKNYVLIVIITNSISLIFDINDVRLLGFRI